MFTCVAHMLYNRSSVAFCCGLDELRRIISRNRGFGVHGGRFRALFLEPGLHRWVLHT